MNTIVIQSGSKEDAQFILKFVRKMKMKARFFSEEELEDHWFGKMIDAGMKEKGEIPMKKFLEKLDKNGSHH